MKNSFWIIGLLLAFMACNVGSRETKAQQSEGKKWDEVMANHDVVMPRMSNTNALKKQLKAYLKEEANIDAATKEKVSGLITNLEKADESMMDWMHGFEKLGTLQKNKTHEEILAYLDKEDKKIQKVKDLFDSSINDAKAFLAANGK